MQERKQVTYSVTEVDLVKNSWVGLAHGEVLNIIDNYYCNYNNNSTVQYSVFSAVKST